MRQNTSKAAVKPLVRHVAEKPSTEENILSAANNCFERSGVRGTTIEDIAAEAKVSRATLYRYFSNKEAIIDRISTIETQRVNAELRRQLTVGASLEETIVECLFLSTRIAHGNASVRRLVEATDFTSRAVDPSSPQHQAYRDTWGNLIGKAFKQKLIATDLDPDSVANWLSLSLNMLLVKVDAVDISDTELRQFIRRFVLLPLLVSPESTG